MKQLIIILIFFLFLGTESAYAQLKIPQDLPTKIPENIKPHDPVSIENVSVSNDINMQYAIRLKNNSSNPIPLSQLKIEIIHYNQDRYGWTPSIELLKPSFSTLISPGQTIELTYRCTGEEKTVLKQLDSGILKYNSLNNISVVIIKDNRQYTYEGLFIWKPKLADLRINDVKVDLVHETSGLHRLKFAVTLENAGNSLPIFLGDTKKETSKTPFLKVFVERKKDNKRLYLNTTYPLLTN